MTHRNAPLTLEGRRRLIERLSHPPGRACCRGDGDIASNGVEVG
jgi:hypothetical protein